MSTDFKQLTAFLVSLGIEAIAHTEKTYLGHLVNVYRLMKDHGCDEDLCRAGMFHSIYGTEKFQGFTLPLERRGEVRELIGERAERLAYWNCAMDRASFDSAIAQAAPPYRIIDRITHEEIPLAPLELDDLCRVHLFDWLEQVPRSRYGWDYRRAAYESMAERAGEAAKRAFAEIFARAPATAKAQC